MLSDAELGLPPGHDAHSEVADSFQDEYVARGLVVFQNYGYMVEVTLRERSLDPACEDVLSPRQQYVAGIHRFQKLLLTDCLVHPKVFLGSQELP